jgi:undecaprenyl-diphosphatase
MNRAKTKKLYINSKSRKNRGISNPSLSKSECENIMHDMQSWHAIVLAIIEGLTEYLPVSSTGHMIITSALMGINESAFTKDFTVIVQFGAILSVLVLYWRRFLSSFEFYKKLFVAFLPAAIIGLAVKNKIDVLLGDVKVVAFSLIIGGVILLFVDRWFAKQEERLTHAKAGSIDGLTFAQSVAIGFCQCFAFIPGVSRSAASIVGGLSLKLTRKAAAEFSFFLAVPTLTAATGYKLLKIAKNIEPGQLSILLIGNLIAFVVGVITIKAFIGFLTRRGFFVFGVYRIILGAIILALLMSGHSISVL